MIYAEAVQCLRSFQKLSQTEQWSRKWEAMPAFQVVWNEAPSIEEFDRIVAGLVLSGFHLWIVGKS